MKTLTITILALLSEVSFATLRCDRKQTFCEVDAKRIVIGDNVVFVNQDQEVVAHGQVTQIDESKRRIDITKRFGSISADDRVIRKEVFESKTPDIKVYKPASRVAVGGTFGLSPMNVSSDATAYNAEAFGQYKWSSLLLTGRFNYFTANGIVDTGEQRSDQGDYSINGFGLLGGVAYHILPKAAVSARVSAEAGMLYTNTSITTQSYPSALDRIGSGVGYAFRGGLDFVYNRFGSLHPMASGAISQYNQARVGTLSIGLMLDLQ